MARTIPTRSDYLFGYRAAIGLTALFGLRAMAPIFIGRVYGEEYSQAVELVLLASGLALNLYGLPGFHG